MFISLCYLVLRRVLQLAAWRFRSNDLKELEIVVLRHELAILQRRTHPSGADVDRPALPRGRWPAPAARTLAVLHHHTGGHCFAGIDAWSRSAGRMRIAPGARRSAVRSERWLSVSRKTARGGVINASSVN